MSFANNMDRDQAKRNVRADLRFILFDTQPIFLLETGCFASDDLNSEDIDVLLIILQIVHELLEGTVTPVFAMSVLGRVWR